MIRRLIALLFGGVLFVALPAIAQVNSIGTSALTISANPTYPGPNSVVQLTAESPLLDLQDSDVEWTVNGTAAGAGQSISVPLGALGSEVNVAVSVSGPTGNDSATLAIVPTSIDLLWESNSYVPPFYKGRAAPGSSSMIRVLAIPHFVSTGGTAIPSSDIDFTWKVNDAIDEAQSGIGESSAVFPAGVLYSTDNIDVVAQSTDGTLSGEASISVRTGDPELVLYEDNPLFGVMYHQALPSSSTASESEDSFAAVPYFASATSANDPSLAYQWTVNGSSVATDPQDPSEITIDAQSADVADITLSLENPSDPFFSASGAWQIAFSGSSGSANNPFGSSQ
jgi:hypothetical protein